MRPQTLLHNEAKRERDRLQEKVNEATAHIAHERARVDRLREEEPLGWHNSDTALAESTLKSHVPELREWNKMVEHLATDGDTEPPIRHREFLRWIIHNHLQAHRGTLVERLVDEASCRGAVDALDKLGETSRAKLEQSRLVKLQLAVERAKDALYEWLEVKDYAEKRWELEEIPFRPVPLGETPQE